MYDIFTSNTKNIDVIQQRTLSQTKTRLDEVFSDNGELFFIERNGEKVGYYLLEDGKHISEHINVDIKFDKNKDFEIVCFGRKLTERNKCPGVIIKSLNGGSVNSIRGIEFFEMW